MNINKDLKMNIIKRSLIILLITLFTFGFFAYFVESKDDLLENDSSNYQNMSFDGTYDWEKEPTQFTSNDDYISYNNLHDIFINSTNVSEINNALSSVQFIRFDSAEELYQFSIDVSFQNVYDSSDPEISNKVNYLLSLDYVLGQDIDYSVMKSRAFIPIGYSFADTGNNNYENKFTGSFDGQGFEIRNLYLAGYDDIMFEEDQGSEIIYTPLASYYAMFTYNIGTIKNLGLVNPNLEILQVNSDLTKLANVVGENAPLAIIDHVYVIDNRESVTEAGIRYRVGSSSLDFEAAGIVHTNNGFFSNSYYTSKVVVNANYINKFTVEPLIIVNNGNASNLVYDDERYLLLVQVGSSSFVIEEPQYGIGEDTQTLKSDISSLNSGNWYFYPEDGYPILKGLDYDSNDGYYEISSAKDLAFFPELLKYNTIKNNNRFFDSNYKLTTNIDMSVLAEGVYKTPNITFNGSFIGTNELATDNSEHYYIHNMVINEYIVLSAEIYAGLFGVLGNGSLIKDVNFTESEIKITETAEFFAYDAYFGAIAGEMISATIEDVYVDVDIDLGQSAIGSIHLGGIVGKASGVIQRVSSNGLIKANNHTFTTETSPVNGNHFIGGVLGKSANAKLVLNEVANRGDIQSFETDSSVTLLTDSELNIYTGGVIGYLDYNVLFKPEFNKLVNSGNITLYSVMNPANNSGIQYMGGVIGLLEGEAPILEEDNEILFANFINEGNVIYDYDSSSLVVNASGVLNTKLDETYELALVKNYGTFNYDISGASFSDFNYAGIINDLGDFDFILSRVYQYGNQTYNSSAYQFTYGMVTSSNNNDILLRYSANYGDIYYMNNAGDTTISLSSDVKISAITAEDNVDYLNVHNYGNLDIVNINTNAYDLFIAGFSSQLSENRVIQDSMNAGNITFADISGSGLVFVGGLVNTNYSGDLETYALDAAQPIATEGVINSLNYGNITTSYNSTRYGVEGTNNTFVGGLVTLNKKSIQDSANLGSILLVNTSSSATATFNTDDNQYYAGIVEDYTGGIVAGGVSAMAIDGESRIYDTANSGNVMAKSKLYVRTGGVLGVSLYEESIAGSIDSNMGLVDTISSSVLSNGLNFGSVSAITESIGFYSTTQTNRNVSLILGEPPATSDTTYSETTTQGTDARPSVYAAAGGVIGYGLSIMRNMLNHGIISSTDVAGGIVGATYVLGGSGSPTTIVNITTAVNYGEIKSISNANFSIIDNQNFNDTEVASYYMSDGNTFIYPSDYSREMPRGKRGFGGIFGRLQRGVNGVMTSEGGSFNFIVNANPNIDLIGRLDQVYNFSSSLRYFRFNDAIYYSAKINDTTQTVFSGFIYSEGGTISDIEYLGYRRERVWWWWYYYHTYRITIETDTFYLQKGTESTSITRDPIETTFDEEVESWGSTPPGSSYTIGETASSGYAFIETDEIPWITENPSDPNITDMDNQYIYDSDFPMRTNPDLTEYIYYAEEDLLATRFKSGGTNPRPNGMYVLSTSAGQTFGEVLPNNININFIELIDESLDLSLNIDYDSISNNDTENLDQAIIDEYNGLKQTEYNDRANLVDDPQKQNFTIEEVAGSENVLNLFDIDYQNKVVTFSISMEAFSASQTTATFDITKALTSANALIGIRASEYSGSLTDLQDELYLERYTDIATAASTKADLTVTLPSQSITTTQTLTLGYFSVYSEAFVMDIADGSYEFSNSDYYNDYRIDIDFLPNIMQAGNYTGVDSVSFNGEPVIDIADSYTVDLRSIGDVDYNGSLLLNFVDYNNIFGNGFDFKDNFVVKFNDGSIVGEEYYTVSSVPFNNGSYTIEFIFDEAIKSGDYYFEYSFYPLSYTYRIDFDKSASPNNSLLDFTYYSENDSIPDPITTNFTSYIDFGDTLTPDSGTFFTITTNSASETYLSDTYDVSYMLTNSLEISAFAEFISAELVDITYTNGYKSYHLEYVIAAEDGTQTTYFHTITERELAIEETQKNFNFIDVDSLFATREAETTKFIIDLGFEEPLVEDGVFNYGDPNALFTINISGIDPEGLPIPSEDITGITYSYQEFLEIDMSIATLPGTYSFEILYSRGAGNGEVDIRTITGDYLEITKLEGQNAYFPDLFFSLLATETLYPDIDIVDINGDIVLDSGYDPQAYFNGFDYDGAKEDDYQYFRITG
ncbi:MAG: hypothetical protein ACOCUD_01075, partial [Bacillota bacterium]